MRQKQRWNTYIARTLNHEPRPLLLRALPFVKGNQALDLGAGALNDSRYLLNQGFSVVAVDGNASILKIRVPVNKVICLFHEFEYPEKTFNLVNAQGSLPFCHPAHFDAVFQKMFNSLTTDGIFCGQLFGNLDDWSTDSEMTFHSRTEALSYLSLFDILLFEEKKYTERKGWHLYNIIARKK